MATEIKVPTLGESVTTATVARWLKQAGDAVAADEPLVELETDKVTVEVNAPAAGMLAEITAAEGGEVEVGACSACWRRRRRAHRARRCTQAGRGRAPRRQPAAGVNPPPLAPRPGRPPGHAAADRRARAAARRRQDDGGNRLARRQLGDGTGKDGRITKGDVLPSSAAPPPPPRAAPAAQAAAPGRRAGEERVKMTRLRRTIAARLKEAQNTAAMLTTFNEVDMSAVMALRAEYKDAFEKKHTGVRLGFMSLLRRAPASPR